jgi:hypothetical protein
MSSDPQQKATDENLVSSPSMRLWAQFCGEEFGVVVDFEGAFARFGEGEQMELVWLFLYGETLLLVLGRDVELVGQDQIWRR